MMVRYCSTFTGEYLSSLDDIGRRDQASWRCDGCRFGVSIQSLRTSHTCLMRALQDTSQEICMEVCVCRRCESEIRLIMIYSTEVSK